MGCHFSPHRYNFLGQLRKSVFQVGPFAVAVAVVGFLWLDFSSAWRPAVLAVGHAPIQDCSVEGRSGREMNPGLARKWTLYVVCPFS